MRSLLEWSFQLFKRKSYPDLLVSGTRGILIGRVAAADDSFRASIQVVIGRIQNFSKQVGLFIREFFPSSGPRGIKSFKKQWKELNYL